MPTFDAVILGNGVLGMSLARALTRREPSMKIAVVGPPSRDGAASLAAGAMINVWAELETGALRNPALAAKFQLARRASELWDEHAASLSEEGEPVSVTWGTYVLDAAGGTPAEHAAFDYLLATLAANGLDHATIDPRELAFLSPDPGRQASRAVRVPDGRVDSRKVIAALDAGLRRTPSCELIAAQALNVEIAPGGPKTVWCDNGDRLVTPNVVFANGPHAQALIDAIPPLRESVPRLVFSSGSAIDVHYHRVAGMPAALASMEHVVRTLDRGVGGGVHLFPLRRGAFYFGSSTQLSFLPESAPRLHAVEGLLRSLRTEFHTGFEHASVAVRGPGYRPVTIDAFPLLGESDVPGVWFLNGTRRDGFTASPHLAAELAKAMLGEPNDLPAIFRPSRPLISYLNRAEAIEAAAQGRLARDVFNDPSIDRKECADRHRRDVSAIYDRRDLVDFGIHPELLHLYDSEHGHKLLSHPRAVR